MALGENGGNKPTGNGEDNPRTEKSNPVGDDGERKPDGDDKTVRYDKTVGNDGEEKPVGNRHSRLIRRR